MRLEKIVAFVAHARIPDFRIGIPSITGKLVGIGLRFHNRIIHGTATLVHGITALLNHDFPQIEIWRSLF